MKQSVLKAWDNLGGSRVTRALTSRAIRILGYHGFAADAAADFQPMLFMRPSTFRDRMERLLGRGYRVIPLREAIERLDRDDIEPGLVVLTIDDGWHGIHEHAFPVLRELRLPATVYVSTYYVDQQMPVVNVLLRYVLWRTDRAHLSLEGFGAGLDGEHALGDSTARGTLAGELARRIDEDFAPQERLQVVSRVAELAGVGLADVLRSRSFHFMTRGQLSELVDAGIDLQLHTHRHRFPSNSRDECVREIGDNRDSLRALASDGLVHFCYPSGAYQPHQKAWLAEVGIASATTTRHGLCYPATDRFELPRFLDSEAYGAETFDAALSGLLALARDPIATLRHAAS